jgi:nicotinate-nucleotide pyrophosphorylase (carboxylating)
MLLEVLDETLLHSVREALQEDVGSGDVTAALLPANSTASASVITREHAVLCGMAWFNAVFAELDTDIEITWQARDGESIEPGQAVCTLAGPARPILTGERTALNFLQTLSGTASRARRYADAVTGLPVKVLDTRKTLPGLRQAQKYAVRTGGCHNHRIGLYDGILIKENHIAAAGSVEVAIRHAREANPGMPVEIEVENETELIAALDARADRLLLDNFSIPELRHAVTLVAGRATLEASGGVTLDTIRDIAATGIDFVSVGELTKDIQAIDFTLLFSLD